MGILDHFRRGKTAQGSDTEEQLKALEDLFGRKREFLREAFSDATLVAASDHLPSWPARNYLGAGGVHALVQMQPIDYSRFPAFLKAVSEGADLVDFLHYRRGAHTTLLKTNEELGARNTWMLTNDVALLERVAPVHFGPPPPWIVFPEIGPLITATQGAPEHWFHNIWFPFWASLTPEKRDLYIDEHAEAALAFMSPQEWEDWVYTTRKFDPEYRQRNGL